jgi:hypothetical protein
VLERWGGGRRRRQWRLGLLERRPAPVFFIPARTLSARVVQQPLRNLLPDGVAAIKPDRVDGLDFYGPLAAAAGDTQHMTLDLRQLSFSDPDAVAGARILEQRVPVFGRRRRIRSRSGGRRTPGRFGGQFFHLFDVRHAPARGSIGHVRLEHNKNNGVESPKVGNPKKMIPGKRLGCRNQDFSIGLNPASVPEFSPPWPRALTGKAFCAFRSSPVPVALYPATSESEKISFNQLNRKTGHRIRYAKVDADTGEEVANEDIVKGYKVDTDTFVEVTKEELENVALESTGTIEIDEFVDRSEIDPRYLIRPTTCVRTARSATMPSRSSARPSGRWTRLRSDAWC